MNNRRDLPVWRLFLLSLLLVLVACDDGSGGGGGAPEVNRYYISELQKSTYTKAQIIEQLRVVIPNVDFSNPVLSLLLRDIEVVAIRYNTTGVDGRPLEASGVVAFPRGTQSYQTLLSIQHGTLDMEEAPSLQLFIFELSPAVAGRVVAMADYQGYGVSQTATRQHSYLHIATTGRHCADMIEAAREYLRIRGIQASANQIELMGYSQGGAATLSTLLTLEERGQTSQVVAAHAGGGAYDLTQTLRLFVERGTESYNRAGYVPYLIRGMEYGEGITLDASRIYAAPVIDNGVISLFESKPLSLWHGALGEDLTAVLHPDFYQPEYNHNSHIERLVTAMEKNSLTQRSAPRSSVLLYHSQKDDLVPYSNAELLRDAWGASLTDLSTPGHIAAGVEFFLRVMGVWQYL